MSFHSLFHLHFKKDLRELYTFSAIFSFASALITIFEPIFLFEQGFSLSAVGLYYAAHYILYVFLLPLGGKFAARFGLEKSITLSLPLFVLYFLSLAAIPVNPIFIYVGILFLTLHKIFYWPSFHALLAKSLNPIHEGMELSWMNVVRYGVPIAGPITGGIIAYTLGFPVLFLIASCIVLVSALPLLVTPEQYRVTAFPYAKPWKMITSKLHRNETIATFGWAENLIDMVYWPLFLFLVLGSTGSVGLYLSLSLVVMMLFGFMIGELLEKYPKDRIRRTYIPFMALGYLFRPFALRPIPILLTDTLARMSFAGVMLPMMHELYATWRKRGELVSGVSFEMGIAITKCITALILAGVFFFCVPSAAFAIAFVLAAVACLLYLKL